MARIQVHEGGRFDLSQLASQGSVTVEGVSREATSVTIYMSGAAVVLRGSGFTYDAAGDPVDGLITSIQSIAAGHTVGRLTGLSIYMSQLISAVQTASIGDDVLLFRAEFRRADIMRGHDRNDRFEGMSGNDRIWGGAGNDWIDGGAGADFIVGGAGKDTLTGGSGRDRFRFEDLSDTRVSRRDVILDFEKGRDKIDLFKIDADINIAGNQSFQFNIGGYFTGRAGDLIFTGGSVLGDVDGDFYADFAIRVDEISGLRIEDFIL